jgi:hypothetical protein
MSVSLWFLFWKLILDKIDYTVKYIPLNIQCLIPLNSRRKL